MGGSCSWRYVSAIIALLYHDAAVTVMVTMSPVGSQPTSTRGAPSPTRPPSLSASNVLRPHFFHVAPSDTTLVTLAQCRQLCKAKHHRAYVAVILSSEEQTIIARLSGGYSEWMLGGFRDASGLFRWTEGPWGNGSISSGAPFYQIDSPSHCRTNSDSHEVDGMFTKWGVGQPDNCSSGMELPETHLCTTSDDGSSPGDWNDIADGQCSGCFCRVDNFSLRDWSISSGAMKASSVVSNSPTQSLSTVTTPTATVVTPSPSLSVPLKPNPRVSAVSDASSVIAISATVALAPLAAVLSGGGPLQRSLLQSQFASSCGDASEGLGDPLDIPSSPTRLAVGSSPARFVEGAVVGNLLLLMGLIGAAYSCSWFAAHVRYVPIRIRLILRSVPLPGWGVQPAMLLLQPIVSSAVTCLVAWGSGDTSVDVGEVASVGVVGVLMAFGGAAWVAWRLSIGFAAEAAWRRETTTPTIAGNGGPLSEWILEASTFGSRLRVTLFEPSWRWRDAPRAASSTADGRVGGGFVARYAPLFEAYRKSMHGFLLVEYAASVGSGVVGGFLPFATGCSPVLLWVMSVMNVCMLLCMGILRPYNCQWDVILSIVSNALSVVWSVTMLAGASSDSGVPDAITIAQLYIQIATPSVPLVVHILRKLSEQCQSNSNGCTTAEAEGPQLTDVGMTGTWAIRRVAGVAGKKFETKHLHTAAQAHTHSIDARRAHSLAVLVRRICASRCSNGGVSEIVLSAF